MNDELKAASERFRTHRMCEMRKSPYYYRNDGGDHGYTDLLDIDSWLLADAMASEHDETPLTAEWLKANGFYLVVKDAWEHEDIAGSFVDSGDKGLTWCVESVIVCDITTVGQLRTLLRALRVNETQSKG